MTSQKLKHANRELSSLKWFPWFHTPLTHHITLNKNLHKCRQDRKQNPFIRTAECCGTYHHILICISFGLYVITISCFVLPPSPSCHWAVTQTST
jgi:hypothetical protein